MATGAQDDSWWTVLWAVGFQELGRWQYWRLLKRVSPSTSPVSPHTSDGAAQAEEGLSVLGDDISLHRCASGTLRLPPLSDPVGRLALACGLGYGMVSAIMQCAAAARRKPPLGCAV